MVATGLLTDEELETYPKDAFTPVELVVKIVEQIIHESDMIDAWGKKLTGKDVHGQAVEINVNNIYFRDQPEWCDDKIQGVMEATDR